MNYHDYFLAFAAIKAEKVHFTCKSLRLTLDVTKD